MPNYLANFNSHLLIEPKPNEKNSFIANVNALVNNLDTVELFNDTFDSKSVELLKSLLATTDSQGNTVADSFVEIAKDLRKGTFQGYRKLDIDLLKNFSGYDEDMTTEEKLSLWGDESKRIYYSGCKIALTHDNIVLEHTFDHILWSAPDLYNELLGYINTFKDISGNTLLYYPVVKTTTVTVNDSTGAVVGTPTTTTETFYDGSVSTGLDYTTSVLNSDKSITYTHITTAAIYDDIVRTAITATGLDGITITDSASNRYIVRIYDSFVSEYGTMQQSNILSVTLIQATKAQYDTLQSPVTKPSNIDNPVYTWSDTTSSLYTIADKVMDLTYTAEKVQNLGDNYIENLKSSASNVEINAKYAEAQAQLAVDRANQTAAALALLQAIGVDYDVVSATSDPSVSYNGNTNKFKFELPRNLITAIDLTDWALNNANGHLTLTTISEADIDSVSVDEANGRVIIQLKS